MWYDTWVCIYVCVVCVVCVIRCACVCGVMHVHVFVCVYVGMFAYVCIHATQYMCEGQRTTLRSQFCSTLWDPGLELRSSCPWKHLCPLSHLAGPILSLKKKVSSGLGMVVWVCNPNTCDVKAGGSRVQRPSQLHKKSAASLGYMKPFLKKWPFFLCHCFFPFFSDKWKSHEEDALPQ